jgi:N4-gp56 family major capsid protein
MAVSSWGVNNALAVKLWSKKLSVEALKECYVGKFTGTGSDSLIQVKTEASKSAGDKVTFGLRMQLTGAGIQGDNTLEGNEEALATYSDAVILDQLRHAVRSGGKMSEQRVPFSVREEAYAGLKDWWMDRYDAWFFNQVAGRSGISDTRLTGNNAAVVPTATTNLIWCSSDHTTDETLDSSGDDFSLVYLDKAVALAKTNSPMIRPIRTNGGEYYVCFIHPGQTLQLRTSTTTGYWQDIQKAALMGGNQKDNPLFTGALGVYNGVILHESTRVPKGQNNTTFVEVANTRRAILCGAQAATLAFGQGGGESKFSWTEELFDYENQLGVAAGAIAGMKKTVFNSKDFGTVVMSSYSLY